MATTLAETPEDAETAPKPKRHHAPIPLDQAPEVNALLEQVGCGKLIEDDDLTSYAGRNDNWIGSTDNGERVFVKRLKGEAPETRMRMRRMVAVERVGGDPESGLRRPRCLGWNLDDRVIAFAMLPDAKDGHELSSDEEFDEALSREAGKCVSALHNLDSSDRGLTGAPHTMPPVEVLNQMPLRQFFELSAGELEAWTLLQGDRAVVRALRQLRQREQEVDLVPSHCDLRLDQFLYSGGRLYVSDWEEFRRADPARDIGAYAGEWLHRAILGIIHGQEEDTVVADLRFTHEMILSRGAEELERVRPLITAFWTSYLENTTVVDDGLAERAVMFAGWHLMDRLLAHAVGKMRLLPIGRAWAGIGRTALLAPKDFVHAVGLTTTA